MDRPSMPIVRDEELIVEAKDCQRRKDECWECWRYRYKEQGAVAVLLILCS